MDLLKLHTQPDYFFEKKKKKRFYLQKSSFLWVLFSQYLFAKQINNLFAKKIKRGKRAVKFLPPDTKWIRTKKDYCVHLISI